VHRCVSFRSSVDSFSSVCVLLNIIQVNEVRVIIREGFISHKMIILMRKSSVCHYYQLRIY